MTSDDPQYNPQDDSGAAGLTVTFRTMPKDLEILYALKEQEQTQPQQAEAIEMPYSLSRSPTIPLEQLSLSSPPPAGVSAPVPAAPVPKLSEKTAREAPPAAFAEKKSAKQQTKELYQQAKSLYKRNFFQEAADKFSELLKISPYHLKGRWYLSRSLNKFKKYQESYLKIYEEETKLKQDFTEKIAAEEREKKEAEQKLLAEEEKSKQETQARAQIEQRLESAQKEKSAMEEQMNRIQEALQKIKQETEKRIEHEFSEKLELKDQEKKTLEGQLAQFQQQKAALEAQLKQEHENLLRAKQESEILRDSRALAQQELLRKEEIRAQEDAKKRLQEMLEQQKKAKRAKELQLQALQEPSPARTRIFDYFFLSKITRIIGVLVATAAVASIFIYLVGLWSAKTTEPEPQPQQSQLILPAPLFQIDKTEIITLTVGQKKNLPQELDRLTTKDLAAGNFVQVLVKITSQDEQKYASLTEFIDSAQLAFPAEILNSLSKDYTVFIYSHKELPLSPFSAGLGKNKIGIVASISDEKNIGQSVSAWEKNMARDLEAMFLGKKISFSTDYQFEEIMYNGFLIRSLNLPNQYSSLNYTFYKDKLIITTSLESIKALIDRMTPQ